MDGIIPYDIINSNLCVYVQAQKDNNNGFNKIDGKSWGVEVITQ